MQIEEDIEFFRRELIFQHTGWIIMMLLLALGCLGQFGTGILSHQKAETEHSTIEYEKFLRFENQSKLLIHTSRTAKSTTIGFSLDYLKRIRIEKTIPEVQSSRIEDGTTFYVFSTAGNAEIGLFITPTETGRTEGIITVNNETFSLSHFVYP